MASLQAFIDDSASDAEVEQFARTATLEGSTDDENAKAWAGADDKLQMFKPKGASPSKGA